MNTERNSHSIPNDAEREILQLLTARMQEGRTVYGPWKLDDGRCYPREALSEVLDALHYCAAELLRIDGERREQRRGLHIFVCYPISVSALKSTERVRAICKRLLAEGSIPLAPHLYLPQLIDEGESGPTERALRLALLSSADELWIFGSRVTPSMTEEIEMAEALGIPVQKAEGSKSEAPHDTEGHAP